MEGFFASVFVCENQVGVVVANPFDFDVRVLIDTARLLQEPLNCPMWDCSVQSLGSCTDCAGVDQRWV